MKPLHIYFNIFKVFSDSELLTFYIHLLVCLLCVVYVLCQMSLSILCWGWGRGGTGTLVSLFLFFWPCWATCRILVPQPSIEPRPWQWKSGILTTRPPWNSHISFFRNVSFTGITKTLVKSTAFLTTLNSKGDLACCSLWGHKGSDTT